MIGKKKFYEDITFNYTAHFDNKINFKSSDVGKPDFFKKMRNGLQHTFSIGLPTFTVLKYVQASPGISYGMNWYFSDTRQYYDTRLKRAVTEYSDPFSTFGLTQTYSFNLSFNTRIYGLFNFGKDKTLQAVRHIITPSLSLNYTPEMGTKANGFRTYEYVDADGKAHSVVYNKYAGQLYSPPGQGSSAGLNFSFGNTLEAKVRSQRDTTGKGVKKVKLIDQLNINGSYNFLADSMKLSNISVNMSTTIFGKMGISGNMTLDPYAINERGQRYNKLMITQGVHFLYLPGRGQKQMGLRLQAGRRYACTAYKSRHKLHIIFLPENLLPPYHGRIHTGRLGLLLRPEHALEREPQLQLLLLQELPVLQQPADNPQQPHHDSGYQLPGDHIQRP